MSAAERPLALITGASSGIGESFARKLAPAHGAAVEVIAADLALPADLARVEARIAEAARLELLVNNAGFGTTGFFWEAPLEEQERMHAVHVMATLRLTHAALRTLVPRDRGAVINVASVAAFARRSGNASYGATKSWMTSFTEALHLELTGRGSRVRVQALCPGFTRTGFHAAMGVDRSSRARSAFWLSADEVVDASLAGLRSGKLFVVPGWRYRLVVAVLGVLPAWARIALERRASR
jgi:uncharacterized protein